MKMITVNCEAGNRIDLYIICRAFKLYVEQKNQYVSCAIINKKKAKPYKMFELFTLDYLDAAFLQADEEFSA